MIAKAHYYWQLGQEWSVGERVARLGVEIGPRLRRQPGAVSPGVAPGIRLAGREYLRLPGDNKRWRDPGLRRLTGGRTRG